MSAIVWVEGLIGSGKTTLTQALAKQLNYREILEPVADTRYLEQFYMCPRRWAFPFQMDMLFKRWELHQLATYEALTGTGAILDRGMPGDMVFAEMHFHAGNIHQLEWETYQRMYRSLMSNVTLLPKVLVYLDVEPKTAYERVKKRGRTSEVHLTLDYLVELRQMYERLLDRIESGKHEWAAGITIQKIDWDYDGIVVEPVVRSVEEAVASR